MHNSVKNEDFWNKLRVARSQAFCNGWVQNSGVVFFLVSVALIVAMTTSTQIRAAALTFACVGTLFVWIVAWVVIRSIAQETDFSGLLSPANELIPKNPCGTIPKEATLVFLGNSASYAESSFPQTIVQIGQDKMLTVDKIDGGIVINATLYSSDKKVIVQLRNNEFFINPNNFFRKERPDRHSLIVFDQHGVEVLNVRFLNEKAIRFSGLIRHPHMDLLISDKAGPFANSVCTQVTGGGAHFAFK